MLMQMSNSLASYPTACPCSKEAFQSNPVSTRCFCIAAVRPQSNPGFLSYRPNFSVFVLRMGAMRKYSAGVLAEPSDFKVGEAMLCMA